MPGLALCGVEEGSIGGGLACEQMCGGVRTSNERACDDGVREWGGMAACVPKRGCRRLAWLGPHRSPAASWAGSCLEAWALWRMGWGGVVEGRSRGVVNAPTGQHSSAHHREGPATTRQASNHPTPSGRATPMPWHIFQLGQSACRLVLNPLHARSRVTCM